MSQTNGAVEGGRELLPFSTEVNRARAGYYWDLVLVLAQKEIKTRYKNNVLGYVWSLANPLAYTGIFYFAFQVVFKIDIPNYVLFLICGLFPWQWISNSVVGSSMIFFQNSSLIKKASFPRFVLPLAIGLQDGFHFLMTLPVIFLFMIIGGVMPTWEFVIGLPLMTILQFFIIYGLGLAIGSINLFLEIWKS